MKSIVLVCAVMVALIASVANAEREQPATYQGKTVQWWAKRTVQARKDANMRGHTIKNLRLTLRHNPTIDEAVRLAHIAYPAFSEARAWQIIGHESCAHCKNLGYIPKERTHAKNPRSSATGIVQFLTSTYQSTPYGSISIYSPFASLLAAGWMHEVGRGCEWDIHPLPSNCR